MSKGRFVWLGVLALLLAASVPVHGEPVQGEPVRARQEETRTAHYPLAPGGRVSVANVQGSIRVEGWDQAEVELTVTKTTSDEGQLSDADVVVNARANALEIRTTYVGEPEEPVTVDYRLRVPRQVRLDNLHTINGDIVVRNVEGAVEARTLNGHIEGTALAGSVTARTVNGNVNLELRRLPERNGTLRLEAINGNLSLLLPAEADADLEVSAVAGRVDSPLAFTASATPGESLLRARLGRGGPRVQLHTIRGHIRVAQSQGVY